MVSTEKLPVATIDMYIKEFEHLAGQRHSHPMRFYARGVTLHEIRDSLHARLERGWNILIDSPNKVAEDHWLDMLERYEKISDLLVQHQPDLAHYAKTLYNAEEI